MHLGIGIVYRDATGLFLLLLLRVIGGQIGRDALPGLTVVARAEQELRSDVESALLIRAHVNRCIPIEAQLAFAIILLRLDGSRFERGPIHAADGAALRLGVDVTRFGGIGKDPESISAIKILPAAVGNAAGVGGIAHPRAVILKPAKHMVRVLPIDAHVIELRDREIVAFPPSVAAVVGIPNATIVSGDQMIGVLRVDPDVVKITVRASDDTAETLAAIFAHDEYEVGFVQFVFVFRIDQQVCKIKRPPHHPTAAVAFFPSLAAVGGTKQGAAIRFDERINYARIGRRDADRDASPRLGWEALRAFFIEFLPGRPAVGRLEETAAAWRGGILTSGSE